MNKQKGIIIGILALAVTMMVGYAIFSETITINGTATAKGDFSYEIVTSKSVSNEINSNELYALYNSEGTGSSIFPKYSDESSNVDSSITSSDNTIIYIANFKYPGQVQYFTVKITNTGSIPITIDLWEEITINQTISGTVKMKDGAILKLEDIEKMIAGYANPYGFTGADVANIQSVYADLDEAFVLKRIYDEVMAASESGSNYYFPKLETGESIYLVFSAQWRDKGQNPNIQGVDITTKETITIPISQYIAG